jgi:hypothetical protein
VTLPAQFATLTSRSCRRMTVSADCNSNAARATRSAARAARASSAVPTRAVVAFAALWAGRHVDAESLTSPAPPPVSSACTRAVATIRGSVSRPTNGRACAPGLWPRNSTARPGSATTTQATTPQADSTRVGPPRPLAHFPLTSGRAVRRSCSRVRVRRRRLRRPRLGRLRRKRQSLLDAGRMHGDLRRPPGSLGLPAEQDSPGDLPGLWGRRWVRTLHDGLCGALRPSLDYLHERPESLKLRPWCLPGRLLRLSSQARRAVSR